MPALTANKDTAPALTTRTKALTRTAAQMNAGITANSLKTLLGNFSDYINTSGVTNPAFTAFAEHNSQAHAKGAVTSSGAFTQSGTQFAAGDQYVFTVKIGSTNKEYTANITVTITVN